MDDTLVKLVTKAIELGASYADARWQRTNSLRIRAENGTILPPDSESLSGIGLRVLVKGHWGLVYTSFSLKSEIYSLPRKAITAAKAMHPLRGRVDVSEAPSARDKVMIGGDFSLETLDLERINDVAVRTSKGSLNVASIKNSISSIAFYADQRHVVSSEGTNVQVSTSMMGVGHVATAAVNGNYERVYDQRSLPGSPEKFYSTDWSAFTTSVAELASKAVGATHPKSGSHPAIIDQQLIGTFLHEAVGHPSEGDIVAEGGSLLQGKLGQQVASPFVTIYDDGGVDGGFPVPYDDEGVRKAKTPIVVKGILRGYLTSRETANKVGVPPTGNARAQNFENPPIVRQTNFYMAPGHFSDEELIRELKTGFFFLGRGAGGGQVDPGAGSFTLNTGPSYRVENGEIKELVRGTTISGDILQTLKRVRAMGRSFKIETSVFGGCGKLGQLAKVGDGGPPVLLERVVVAGA